MGKKHFCFFQTAETGNRTPNSGVKGSGANHNPRAPARQMSSELDYPKMYKCIYIYIYILRQVTSKQQVIKKMYCFDLSIFQYRDYVVCHLKLEIGSAIKATN